MRRAPIFASDVRRLRGVVSVHQQFDRATGEAVYRVSHVSGGGDIAFTSAPISLQDHAEAAARLLAEFVNAKVLDGPAA